MDLGEGSGTKLKLGQAKESLLVPSEMLFSHELKRLSVSTKAEEISGPGVGMGRSRELLRRRFQNTFLLQVL